ncbi:MAG: FtsQ-type POTRA domain-containing protein [Longicatena sp.]
MEDIDDILYDEVEAKCLALQNKKKNRKKKRRKRRACILGVVIILGIFYFSSDLSKVKSLEVKGNTFYTKDEVLKKANLSYNTRYIVMPKFYIKWELEKDSLIKNATVSKKINGSISITIEEKPIVGYLIENNVNYALINDGTKIEIKSEYLNTIVNFPLIDGFSNAELKNLCAGFAEKENQVKPEIIHMMSEMMPYETSYDKHMVKIIMQDGNTMFSSYESLPLLNNYLETLKSLNKDHACLWADAMTGSIQSLDCAKKE